MGSGVVFRLTTDLEELEIYIKFENIDALKTSSIYLVSSFL